jgi:molecular chaperone GrpE
MGKEKISKEEIKIEKQEDKIINEQESLLNKIKTLEEQLSDNVQKIKTYEQALKELNDDYAKKLIAKSEQANKMVNDKLLEITEKYNMSLANVKKYAIEKDATKLVEIVNQFNTAVAYPVSDANVAKYQVGFKMFSSMFNNLLNDIGVKEIKVSIGDEFDSHFMEAYDTMESHLLKDNQVGAVISSGYKLHDRIIKTAIVKVVKK